MLNAMRTRLLEVMKAPKEDKHAEIEKNILRVAIAELDALRLGTAKVRPEDMFAKIRKLIQSNNETAKAHATRGDLVEVAKLHEENEILEAYLPKVLTAEQIKEALMPIYKNIQMTSTRSEGQAIGVAMKHLRPLNLGLLDGAIVSQVVRDIIREIKV